MFWKKIPLKILCIWICILFGKPVFLHSQTAPLDYKQILENTANPDSVLHEMRKKKNFSDSVYQSNITIGLAFSKANELRTWEAVFLLKKANILILKGEEIAAINIGMGVLEEIKRGNLTRKNLLADALLMVSVGYQNLGAYAEAISFRKEHVKETYLGKKQLRYVNSHSAIGKLYLQMDFYDSARYHYQKALAKTQELGQQKREAGMLNNIGLVYFEEMNYDSAELNYQRSLAKYNQVNLTEDSVMLGIVGGNLAMCLTLDKKDEIIRLLNSNIRLTTKYTYLSSLANAYFNLGNLYFELDNFTTSKTYLDSAYQVNLQMNPSLEQGEGRVNIYEAYMQIFEKTGQAQQSLRYAHKLLQLNDSLFGKDFSQRVSQQITDIQVSSIQNDLGYTRLKFSASQKELKKVEAEEKLAKTQLFLVGAISLIGVIIFLFVLYKLKSDQHKRIEMEALSKRFLEAENEHKTQRLTQSALSLQRKGEFAKQVVSKISEMDGVSPQQLSAVKVFIQNEIQMDESQTEMEKYVDDLSKDFIVKLKLSYPDLTDNDLKLCGLVALNLSLKEISVVKNITPNSVKIAKNRLRKKLALEPGTNLYVFLKKFAA